MVAGVRGRRGRAWCYARVGLAALVVVAVVVVPIGGAGAVAGYDGALGVPPGPHPNANYPYFSCNASAALVRDGSYFMPGQYPNEVANAPMEPGDTIEGWVACRYVKLSPGDTGPVAVPVSFVTERVKNGSGISIRTVWVSQRGEYSEEEGAVSVIKYVQGPSRFKAYWTMDATSLVNPNDVFRGVFKGTGSPSMYQKGSCWMAPSGWAPWSTSSGGDGKVGTLAPKYPGCWATVDWQTPSAAGALLTPYPEGQWWSGGDSTDDGGQQGPGDQYSDVIGGGSGSCPIRVTGAAADRDYVWTAGQEETVTVDAANPGWPILMAPVYAGAIAGDVQRRDVPKQPVPNQAVPFTLKVTSERSGKVGLFVRVFGWARPGRGQQVDLDDILPAPGSPAWTSCGEVMFEGEDSNFVPGLGDSFSTETNPGEIGRDANARLTACLSGLFGPDGAFGGDTTWWKPWTWGDAVLAALDPRSYLLITKCLGEYFFVPTGSLSTYAARWFADFPDSGVFGLARGFSTLRGIYSGFGSAPDGCSAPSFSFTVGQSAGPSTLDLGELCGQRFAAVRVFTRTTSALSLTLGSAFLVVRVAFWALGLRKPPVGDEQLSFKGM